MFSKVIFIAERTEMPFHNKKKHGFYKYINRFNEIFAFKNLDGFLVISHALIPVYTKLVSKKCPIVLIPVIIDVGDVYKPEIQRTRNIIYTGPLLQEKDGILTIIQSFSKIAEEFPETKLICTGSLELSEDKDSVVKEIERSKASDRIIMKGFIKRDEMIDLLNSAVCLVLAKPLSLQADTCFPTKLGEYLATGNPIVVTETGEIPRYLTDGVNAYIAQPDSVDSFTNKLKILLSHPEKAKEVGLKGREVAEISFNYAKTAIKVIDLIETIKKDTKGK